MGMFAETAIVDRQLPTVYRMPAEANKLPFSLRSKQRKFAFSNCSKQTEVAISRAYVCIHKMPFQTTQAIFLN
jgi:hypothetical protein